MLLRVKDPVWLLYFCSQQALLFMIMDVNQSLFMFHVEVLVELRAHALRVFSRLQAVRNTLYAIPISVDSIPKTIQWLLEQLTRRLYSFQPSLVHLHGVDNGLKNSLVVQGAETSTFRPPHLAQQSMTLVFRT